MENKYTIYIVHSPTLDVYKCEAQNNIILLAHAMQLHIERRCQAPIYHKVMTYKVTLPATAQTSTSISTHAVSAACGPGVLH
jgi:hypothetical protein